MLDSLLRERCTGDRAGSLQLAEQALERSRTIDWREGIARSMLQLARFQEPATALETILEARKIFRKLGDRKGEADALHNMGLIHRYDGQYAMAAWFYGRAFEILEEEGNGLHEQAQVLASLCITQFDRGEIAAGLDVAADAIALCRREHLGDLEVHLLAGTARALWLHGQHHAALIYASRSLRLFPRKAHDRTEKALAEALLSGIQVDLGSTSVAIDRGRRALKLLQREARRHEEAVLLLGLGLARHLQEAFIEARDHYIDSLHIATEMGDRMIRACALAMLGGLNLSQGSAEQALDDLLRSEAIAAELDDRQLLALAHYGLYRARKSSGNSADALIHLEEYMKYSGGRTVPGAGLRFCDLPVHDEIDRRRRREEICRMALPPIWSAEALPSKNK
jgi:tetratricopeptide (TPR) repeat protein